MSRFASLLAGHRGAALLWVSAVALLAPAPAAEAQRLLTLVSGVGEAASVGDPGPSIGPVPTAVQVDLDLLRAAPARLEVSTPDGSVLSAERSVFEDRGGGDLMWSGGQPGAGYDTVVLTVEGGRLVGRIGAAGGVYEIHAERDGRGGMAPVVGPSLEAWCGVAAGAEEGQGLHGHVRPGALAADLPRRLSSPQRDNRLDILAAYTAKAAENWADRGGARAAIRHAGDYLKMVFRNNRINVVPHIVHMAQASATLDRVGRDLGRHEWPNTVEGQLLDLHLSLDRDLETLRIEHRADMVYLFVGENPRLHGDICGVYNLLTKYEVEFLTRDEYSYRPIGWGSNFPHWCGDYAAVFAHEIGHGLGAHHEPANLVGFLDPTPPSEVKEGLVAPYALGYVNYDVMPSLGTVVSYQGQIEPFFSTARIRPYGGAVLGITRQQDSERILRETVPLVAQGDDLGSLEGLPAQPTHLRARFSGASALLFWQDNAPDADGYEVGYRHFLRPNQTGWGREYRVEGRTEAVIPMEFMEPGGRHEFSVRAWKDDLYSPWSSPVVLFFPGAPIKAPSDVSVAVDPDLWEVEVHWTDNSGNETGFDVQLLLGGEPILRARRPADSTNAIFYAATVLPRQRAEYGVRVFAFNSTGQSPGSETATFQWDHPLAPGPVADVTATAIGPTAVRVAWTVDPKVETYRVRAKLRAWQHRRDWFPPTDGAVETGWVDFEGLARGGRYTFEVTPRRPRGLPSRAYLALGERGAGPARPSDVSLVTRDGQLRLSWVDNSSDELGFEIQNGVVCPDCRAEERWWRAATVPRDTESAVFHPPVRSSEGLLVRVFAYNERGFSLSSPRVSERSATPSDPCRADAETLCLQDSRFEVKVNWWNAAGESGIGQVAEDRTSDSGLFRFFDPENWEILIKVLDGCAINGRMWVLGASTTDLGYRILVSDTLTGVSRSYENEPGQPAPAIVDTEAFSSPCSGEGLTP